MKHYGCVLLAILILVFVAGAARASLTVDFETGPSGGWQGEYALIPSGYAGLEWSNFHHIEKAGPYPNYDYGVVDDFAAFNSWGRASAISDSAFDFIGATFTAVTLNTTTPSTLSLDMEGYLGGSLVASRTLVLTLNNQTAVYDFDAQWNAVDRLEFSETGEDRRFVIDNIELDAAVPEPASVIVWSLLGMGWAGLCVWRRRGKPRLTGGAAGPQPWSDETKAAIVSIIERGRTR